MFDMIERYIKGRRVAQSIKSSVKIFDPASIIISRMVENATGIPVYNAYRVSGHWIVDCAAGERMMVSDLLRTGKTHWWVS